MTRTRCIWASIAAGLLTLASCVYLPRFDDAPITYAVSAQADSRIADMLAATPAAARKALLIEDPQLALTSRIDLIDAADNGIDAQYFIWQNDSTGILVIDRLLAAADRGVRVRVLVDDIQLEGLVDRLTALDEHPNIEIRIFNPFSVRLRLGLSLFRVAEFAIDGNRLNHRMHNKLIVADNQVAILGGRNIGDDYFGQSKQRNFIDTDILLSGHVVQDLSQGFDTYWNSRWAYPVGALINFSLISLDLDSIRKRIRRRLADHPDLRAVVAQGSHENVISALGGGAALISSEAVVDDPSVSWLDRPNDIAVELAEIALTAEREVLIVSPYFIPTPNLLPIGKALMGRGVKITVLTNSLASNDVVIAHAAYARYRRQIVASGAELYEMRGDPEMMLNDAAEDFSLHSKYIIFDDEVVFIGSTNLDPRSLYLNTELGVVLRSPELADALRASFHNLIKPENAWRVTAAPEGFSWQSAAGVIQEEPAKGVWQRFRAWIYSFVPVSSQL